MSTYAIGDIQGCFEPMQALLEQIDFNPSRDRLWFTGDLVNRGPHSLETLRFVKGLGDAAITVLGNHDLHLLAVWRDRQRYFRNNDTLGPIFEADDGEELLEWLRHQPLMHHDAELGISMVHAGLPPQWDIDEAMSRAHEVEAVLRGERFEGFLEHMYGNQPAKWHEELEGWERLRFIVNSFTRLRYCTAKGKLEFNNKGTPGEQDEKLLPWFQVPGRRSADSPIVFGHWSTLGLLIEDDIKGIDTGCLWGGQMTALRLEDGEVFQWQCPESMHPGGE